MKLQPVFVFSNLFLEESEEIEKEVMGSMTCIPQETITESISEALINFSSQVK